MQRNLLTWKTFARGTVTEQAKRQHDELRGRSQRNELRLYMRVCIYTHIYDNVFICTYKHIYRYLHMYVYVYVITACTYICSYKQFVGFFLPSKDTGKED